MSDYELLTVVLMILGIIRTTVSIHKSHKKVTAPSKGKVTSL